MKELAQIWSRVTGRRYSAVNTNDRELRDFANNRLQNIDIDGNLSECEATNKFTDDIEFHQKKNAIINRLFERRRKGQITRQPKSLFIVLLLGFLALGTGLFILFLKPYDFLFKLKTVMADGGEIFEMWRKPQIDLYCKVYLFNITNGDDFMSGKDKNLKFQEVGPYVYKENLEHTEVKFNENGTLSTIPIHPLTWVEELSEGNKEDDMLFLPNIALLSISSVVHDHGIFATTALKYFLGYTSSATAIVKMTAKEFMMGYKSDILSWGNTMLPGWITFNKLGLIDRMYDFKGEYETIFTGESDVTLSGLIDTYKGVTDLPQWKGTHCSNVQYASDGTKFKGALSKNESLLFYRKSLCRAATMVPVKQGQKHGFDAYLYTFEDNLLDNGKYNEKNKCFCRKDCLPAGLIDVTDCYYGFPIALSYPHFYKGDDELFNKVEGLSPDKEKHETRFWIQPESGLPLDVTSKFQINMALQNLNSIDRVKRFSNMVLPMLWFDITMSELPPSLAYRFKLYLNVLPVVERGAMYVLLFVGVLLVLLAVCRLTFKVMFRTFDYNCKRQRNIIIGTSELWVENGGEVYQSCEMAFRDESTDSDEAFDSERRPSGFIKTHSDKIKELSLKLGDKVYDSVSSAKSKVRDELTHVKQIFKDMESRKNSLIPPDDEVNTNEAYKTDSTEDSDPNNDESTMNYNNYLEVVEDDYIFTDRRNSIK